MGAIGTFRIMPAALATALVLGSAPAPSQERTDPREGLEAFEVSLDQAVARVSRPSAAQAVLQGAACRGYHLKGYGAVFILPPQALPLQPRSARRRPAGDVALGLGQATRRLEEAMGRVGSEELRRDIERSLEALRRTEAEVRVAQAEGRGAKREEQRALERRERQREMAIREAEWEIRAHAEALQREAERAQAQAEHALEEMSREVRIRLAGPPSPPVTPPAQAAPAAPPAPPAPPAVAPAPPWSFWFETEEAEEARTPERVITDVGGAVTDVLEAQGTRLRILGPDDYLVVAVDFFHRGLTPAFSPTPRAQRTLVVRVRKKEIEERQAGRIAPEELRRRVEYVQY